MFVTHDQLQEELLNLNTAFVGKVISANEDKKTVSVQPLNMMKQYGKAPTKRSVIANVPVLSHVRHYKTVDVTLSVSDSYSGGGSISPAKHTGHVQVSFPKAGDIVFCMCADRDITATRHGNFATPVAGHHMISSCVVVGLL